MPLENFDLIRARRKSRHVLLLFLRQGSELKNLYPKPWDNQGRTTFQRLGEIKCEYW
jgi:hypothetical protein